MSFNLHRHVLSEAKEKADFSYLDIGHDSDFMDIILWAYFEGKDDIMYLKPESNDDLLFGHELFKSYCSSRMLCFGRIDKRNKAISMAIRDPGDHIDYSESLLRMDYPGYNIVKIKSALYKEAGWRNEPDYKKIGHRPDNVKDMLLWGYYEGHDNIAYKEMLDKKTVHSDVFPYAHRFVCSGRIDKKNMTITMCTSPLRGNPRESDAYVESLLKMDYPGYSLIKFDYTGRIASGKNWYKLATIDLDRVKYYTEVGHGDKGTRVNDIILWASIEGKDDIEYRKIKDLMDTHSKVFDSVMYFDFSGRIDKKRKIISMYIYRPNDPNKEKENLIESILRMDFPGYRILKYGYLENSEKAEMLNR